MDDASIRQLKKAVLGLRYDLSVAFLNARQMRQAMKYKKKPTRKISNVLAFPLSKTSGEILICKEAAKPYTVEYLLIHGLLHLKGLKHSATMERKENTLLKRFSYAKSSNGNRRRHLSNQSRHRTSPR